MAGGGDAAKAHKDIVGIFGDSRLLHSAVVYDVVYSSEGKLIASASHDGTAKIWDARTGRRVQTLIGHSRQVTSVAFSEDARRVATGSADGTVRVWDVRAGREEAIFKNAPSHPGVDVALSPSGDIVASAGAEVIAWDVATGQQRMRKALQSRCVALSPDGKTLAAATSTNATCAARKSRRGG